MNPRALLCLILIAPLTACAPELGGDLDTAFELDVEIEPLGNTKVDICHITGSGSINILNVSSSAVTAHLAHGDHLSGVYFLDMDGDGEGDTSETSECLDPGYVENDDDCDDDDADIYTDAEEVCGDGVDNDCDDEIDEDCTVEVEIHVNGDNGVWAWVDGVPVTFDYNLPHWYQARSATLELDSGVDHAFAFYVEDWGGLAYFAASVRIDGQVVVASGDGDFTSTGALLGYVDDWARIADWAATPATSADSPNMLFSPGTTWGDWTLPGFDDSSWQADTNTCTSPTYWNMSWFSSNWSSFADLAADGAETVWHDFGYYPLGSCYSLGDSAVVFRTELAL